MPNQHLPLDPFALPRPPKLTRKLQLEHQGRHAEIELRQMDLLDTHRMVALRDRMIAKYISLDERTGNLSPQEVEPVDFPPVGGEPVSLNEETCEACATLAVMQSTFTFEALVALALTAPHLFERLIHEAGNLNRGKAPTAGTGAPSEPPSKPASVTTPS